MKYFSNILITFFCFSILQSQNALYVSDAFNLRLFNQNGFVFYAMGESAAKENVSGNFVIKNDSLILTTHKADNEQVIFAIYQLCDYNLQLLYGQKQFSKILPQQFSLLKNMYTSGTTKDEIIWTDKKTGNFERYTFAENGAVQEINQFVNYKKEGKQLLFFSNNYGAIQKEETYKNGLKHGKVFYFENIDGSYLQVALVKKENYKEGELVRTKEYNNPPVYLSGAY